jgi:guanylate kinase/non-canonical purine NTP pyrophosphatase (RdgB/HAM1 family)
VKVVLASGNPGKLRELAQLLAPHGIRMLPQSAFGLQTPPETGTTFRENALLKARYASHRTGLPALADDSGIEVDALQGRPGVYSARYAGEGASDAQNLEKLLAELQSVPDGARAARYRCVMALVRGAQDPQPLLAEGTWQGQILRAPRGTGGFGYDPVFLPDGLDQTAAELPPAQKNALSHRGQALRALAARAGELPGIGAPGRGRVPGEPGRLFVLAAPSGAGKTSLVRALLERKPSLSLSISHTTRPQRPTETNGREYHFVDTEAFERSVAEGRFLEHARVFGNYYGTAREPVARQLAAGGDVVLEIDWQGARQVRAAMPACESIFVLPPSRTALEQRLRGRATDSAEVIARRLREAAGDMTHWHEFDYVVVNDQFERALEDLVQIVEGRGEALLAGRPALAPLLSQLLASPGVFAV